MNKTVYKVESFHQGVLEKVRNKFKASFFNKKELRVNDILIYLRWQVSNSLKTQQNAEYLNKNFTVLRSPFVNKKSREQFSIAYYSTKLVWGSIFNSKYLLSNYNVCFFTPSFVGKQYYIRESKSNCYLFKK